MRCCFSFITRDRALAGVSGCHGTDSVGRCRNVVTAVFYDDGVAAGAVGDVDHSVGTVAVVVDAGLLRFPIWILKFKLKALDLFDATRSVRVHVTDRDLHAQLALPGVTGVDVELDGEACGDAAGQPGAAGSHFTGIVSRKNSELEGTEETKFKKIKFDTFHR